jgi:hypothetical protein
MRTNFLHIAYEFSEKPHCECGHMREMHSTIDKDCMHPGCRCASRKNFQEFLKFLLGNELDKENSNVSR